MKSIVPLLILASIVGCGKNTTAVKVNDPKPNECTINGLHNTFRITNTMFSGNAPETDEAFESLRRKGIKTIISVDGAVPQWEKAKSLGIRYVHIPMGYDGLTLEKQILLARVMKECEVPVYVHCHHGKHRGPTAVAFMQLCANPQWNTAIAKQWLKDAGTDPLYAGLYKAVEDFRKPSEEELKLSTYDFPAFVKGPELVQRMVQMDEHWGELRKRPTLALSVMLLEDYREVVRQEPTRPHDFKNYLLAGEAYLKELNNALQEKNVAKVEANIKAIGDNCKNCHEKHRNNRK